MRIKDVPLSPAYLVCHDHYMGGAMDIYPRSDFAQAQTEAKAKNDRIDAMGEDGAHWSAYENLPRVKVWKYHPSK